MADPCDRGVAAGAVLAQPAGESWEMTATMQIEGMKMPMAPSKMCLKTGEAAMRPMEKTCKPSDVKVSGNTTSFKVVCGPPEPMEGGCEMTRKGDRMEGHDAMKSTEGEMVMPLSGRKLGGCTPGAVPGPME